MQPTLIELPSDVPNPLKSFPKKQMKETGGRHAKGEMRGCDVDGDGEGGREKRENDGTGESQEARASGKESSLFHQRQRGSLQKN